PLPFRLPPGYLLRQRPRRLLFRPPPPRHLAEAKLALSCRSSSSSGPRRRAPTSRLRSGMPVDRAPVVLLRPEPTSSTCPQAPAMAFLPHTLASRLSSARTPLSRW